MGSITGIDISKEYDRGFKAANGKVYHDEWKNGSHNNK
jgi:hypothetical protein